MPFIYLVILYITDADPGNLKEGVLGKYLTINLSCKSVKSMHFKELFLKLLNIGSKVGGSLHLGPPKSASVSCSWHIHVHNCVYNIKK